MVHVRLCDERSDAVAPSHKSYHSLLQGGQFSVWPYSNGHFPGGPGLASSRMSPFCILLQAFSSKTCENPT